MHESLIAQLLPHGRARLGAENRLKIYEEGAGDIGKEDTDGNV
jgi:hypothetical protein